MTNIPTKIGWEMVLPLNIIFIAIIIATKGEIWEPILIMGIICLIMNYIFFSIKYYSDDEYFYIKSGIFGTQKIKISDIYKIEKSNNLIASPAPSIFGRSEIYFTNGSVVISPKNFQNFVQIITKVNPNITIKE